MKIILTDGAEAREYIERIERLGGEVTPEVTETVAQKADRQQDEVVMSL